MRSPALVVPAVLVAAVLAAGPATAEPGTARFETLCTPSDPGLEELSGLTVIDGVTYAIGDGGTDHRLAVLDGQCAVSRWLDVPVDPFDVEDLGSYSGDLWLSDTGDNQRLRPTVALTRMTPSDGQGELYRLVYPDGPHDAETLLIEPGGRPVIITKDATGVSGIYVPEGDRSVSELASPGPTPLEKVGELAFTPTTTPGGPPIIVGSILATGGAVSIDGSVAAVRTYNDVYLFPIEDGDVVEALTGEPVVVAVPDQPQGEALAFDADGNLLLASEAAGGPMPPILVLEDATSLVRSDSAAVGEPNTSEATTELEGPSDSRWTLGALAVAAVLILGSIAYAVRSALRRR
ncbi:hypothetical protein [Rhodococcus sp. KRD197]|uniref:hypothetical protein n=1 Tax=unclassified Rhodococcus (in: high G+C Gram-positive bacteria) TaxID=192944 RepID=UPI001F494BFB|nr:hypothetical protein [Rhodococcus sp. KRD197]